MDAATTDAFNWSLDFLARTLAGILATLGFDRAVPSLIPRSVWVRALRDLRDMEALARRLIVVLSGSVTLDGMVNRNARPSAATPETSRRGSVNAPGFSLVETELDPFALAGCPAMGADTPRQLPDRTPLSGMVYAAPLIAQLDALKAAIENPEPIARRLARRRQRSGPSEPGVMIALVKFLKRRRNPTSDLMESTLWHAHQMAVAELNRACPWHAPPDPPPVSGTPSLKSG
ncbi:MAG: hypothetical protein AAFX86_01990 [Pseudomonadota bacterium]